MTGGRGGAHHEARYETRLACGHVVTFSVTSPQVGDTVWCLSCDAARSVTYVRMF